MQGLSADPECANACDLDPIVDMIFKSKQDQKKTHFISCDHNPLCRDCEITVNPTQSFYKGNQLNYLQVTLYDY